ncbi:MAG: TadE/TadG family type IV pilus assembly protein [Acidimicrobiia bacterium]
MTIIRVAGGRKRRGPRAETGAAMVETAFMMPVLLALVFGIIDFGFAFNSYISERQGTAQGGRQAIVANFGSNSTCPLTGLTGAGSNSLETKQLMCLVKDRVGLDEAKTRVGVSFGSGGYAVGQPVLVCVEYPLSSVTHFFGALLDGKVLKSKAELRIEQVTTTSGSAAFAAAAETPQSGSWSWCA